MYILVVTTRDHRCNVVLTTCYVGFRYVQSLLQAVTTTCSHHYTADLIVAATE